MDSFTPDWTETWTAEEAEAALCGLIDRERCISDEELVFQENLKRVVHSVPFKFNGPGWYFLNGDTVLVIPVELGKDGNRWNHRWEAGTKFQFNVWNGGRPEILFGEIANAPTRLDDR